MNGSVMQREVQPEPAATLFCVTDQKALSECLHCSCASAIGTLQVVPGLSMCSHQGDGGRRRGGGEKKKSNASVVMESQTFW